MILIETGKYRFFVGDNVHYRQAPTEWLSEQAGTAEDLSMRRYAAAGLMRALLDTSIESRDGAPFPASIEWVQDVILDVQAGAPTISPAPKDVEEYVYHLPPVNGVFDATSVTATEANKPDITAAIINKHISKTDPKLVIALGHGGILSTLATFSALSGDNVFYPLRYSRNKAKDDMPVIADSERELLQKLAKDREVIVHDEDRGLTGDTIRTAVSYIDKAFNVSSFGVTPVLARHPGCMWPEIIRKAPDGRSFMTDTYSSGTQKFQAIVDELADKA